MTILVFRLLAKMFDQRLFPALELAEPRRKVIPECAIHGCDRTTGHGPDKDPGTGTYVADQTFNPPTRLLTEEVTKL